MNAEDAKRIATDAQIKAEKAYIKKLEVRILDASLVGLFTIEETLGPVKCAFHEEIKRHFQVKGFNVKISYYDFASYLTITWG